MTPHQAELLDFLRHSEPTPAARKFLKRTGQQFVLDNGWLYERVELPKTIQRGMPNECHRNAVELTLADSSLVYCEGYALFGSGSLPTIHAWVTDGDGNAIDNTWDQPGVAYAGVPFDAKFVSVSVLGNSAVVSLIDDYLNDWPLRRELGDQPEEWLELAGRGRTRLIESREH